MTTAQYDIPEQNLGWIREKVAKLNKRAEKLGVTGIQFNVVSEEVREFRRSIETGRLVDVTGIDSAHTFDARISIKFVKVEVIGDAPVLNGWKFVGTLQHVEENGTVNVTILRAAPGEQIPETYRDAPNWCDQCRMNRIRNDTFIVRQVESGEFKQVGRNCLEDFLGHADPHKLADWAEELSLFAELMRGARDDIPQGRRDDRVFRINDVLSLASCAVYRFGFVSRKKQREAEENGEWPLPVATGDRVMSTFFGNPFDVPGSERLEPTVAHIEQAEKALEWARTELQRQARAPNANDYIYNLAAVTKLTYIDARMMNIAVSLIPVYQREMNKRAGFEERAARSKYFGTPGVRAVFTLTVRAVRSVHLANGEPCNVIEFEDVDGNEAVWFTSGVMDLGVTYRVKATVKRHSEFRGIKQTALSRINVVERMAVSL